MQETTINEIRKVNTGEIEINYEVKKSFPNKEMGKPDTERYYTYSVVIPKNKIKDLKSAIADKRY